MLNALSGIRLSIVERWLRIAIVLFALVAVAIAASMHPGDRGRLAPFRIGLAMPLAIVRPDGATPLLPLVWLGAALLCLALGAVLRPAPQPAAALGSPVPSDAG